MPRESDRHDDRTGIERELKRGSLELIVLYRLERGGFVAVRWETPERGVPRKYYRLTETGRAELARLKHEWNTFVTAMAQLLATEEGT